MSKSINEERAKQLYLQCKRAYKDTKKSSGTVWNDDGKIIPVPSHFDDTYNIPAELLFKELQTANTVSRGARFEFDHQLLRAISNNIEYDSSNLRRSIDERMPLKPFSVYFQIYFQKENSAPNPFNQQITLEGIKYKWCSKSSFSRLVSLFERSEGNIDSHGLYRLYRDKKFPKIADESNLHAIKAIVQATDIVDATDKVATAFYNFMCCINVAQSFGFQSFSLVANEPKPRSTIAYTGVFLVKDITSKQLDILWTDDRRYTLPSQRLKMTSNKNKMIFLSNLRKAFRDSTSPAAKRLRRVTLELAAAIDTEDSSLRQLGFWRCLEIATRKSSENRKEKDIVKIFQNYYPETPHWKQQGQLVLDTRNAYVHQGVSSNVSKPSDFYLNWSKQYAEAVLNILIYLYNSRSIWKTENDIDTFFDHYSQSDRALELAGKLLAARNKSKKSRTS